MSNPEIEQKPQPSTPPVVVEYNSALRALYVIGTLATIFGMITAATASSNLAQPSYETTIEGLAAAAAWLTVGTAALIVGAQKYLAVRSLTPSTGKSKTPPRS